MPEGEREDCCGSTPPPVVRKDCCGSTPTSAVYVFEDRLSLGRRRQHQVRQTVAWLSAALCVAAAALYLAGGPLRTLAPRVAWAAAALGVPRLLRALRDLLTGSHPAYRVLALVPVVTVGILGYPLISAAAVALVLVSESVRRPVPSMPASAPALSSSEVG